MSGCVQWGFADIPLHEGADMLEILSIARERSGQGLFENDTSSVDLPSWAYLAYLEGLFGLDNLK